MSLPQEYWEIDSTFSLAFLQYSRMHIYKDNKKNSEGIEENLSSRKRFVSSSSVFQGPVNDCKAFPAVQSVVHSHTNEVLPFAAARIPLTAQMHTVRFCKIEFIIYER